MQTPEPSAASSSPSLSFEGRMRLRRQVSEQIRRGLGHQSDVEAGGRDLTSTGGPAPFTEITGFDNRDVQAEWDDYLLFRVALPSANLMDWAFPLRAVKEREIEAAMAGGRTWREFVRWAERTLGEPWSVIRERLQ